MTEGWIKWNGGLEIAGDREGEVGDERASEELGEGWGGCAACDTLTAAVSPSESKASWTTIATRYAFGRICTCAH
eukprot:3138897-Rhodomonas_salina.1